MELALYDGNGNEETILGECMNSQVDEGSVESHRYYLCRRTVLEMLRDRGYAVPDSEINLTVKQFREIYSDSPDLDRLRILASLKSDPLNKIMVVFCGPDPVKVSVIRGIATQVVNQDGLTRMILIVESPITNQALKAVELFRFKVEFFKITDLLVNITKHVLKPKHRILTAKEKEKLLKKYSINEKQLPRMMEKDAFARYYGLEKGQVVKVTYNGEITESHVTYRCVW